MNSVVLIGRLTKDPEMRGAGDIKVASFFLAVDRPKKKDGDDTDFIKCSVFGKTAEMAEKYLKKGIKIAIEGSIRSTMYTDKSGTKRMSFEVNAARVEFCEKKGEGGSQGKNDGFYPVDDANDDDLPF